MNALIYALIEDFNALLLASPKAGGNIKATLYAEGKEIGTTYDPLRLALDLSDGMTQIDLLTPGKHGESCPVDIVGVDGIELEVY